MLPRFAVLLALSLGAACSAAPPSDEPAGRARQPIVRGWASSDAQNAVVLLFDRKESFECTGTLIAPSLVVTARHCVTHVTSGDALSCARDGSATKGGELGDDYNPNELEVFVGATRASPFPDAAARGTKVLHDDAKNVCNHDVALLAIAPPVASVAPAKLRLDAAPSMMETLTVVGWGASDTRTVTAARAQRMGVRVLAVGPATFEGLGVPPNDFLLGESTCNGDSGAPAFDVASGAVVGIDSYGLNGSYSAGDGPAAGCLDEGSGVFNTFTALAPFKDLIARALSEASPPAP